MGLHGFDETVELAAHKVLRIENGIGTRIFCQRGDVWITQHLDQRDIVISAGESVLLDREGLALVMAFSDAELLLQSPGAQDRLAA